MALIRGHLYSFLESFKEIFRNKTKDNFKTAVQYIEGLFSNVRSNCSSIAKLFGNKSNNQRLNHLINESKWNELDLMDKIANRHGALVKEYNLENDATLLIDECSFSKKGKNSVGVERQYNGNKGKTDNCQVGVFGALNAGSITTIIRGLLYKPKEGKTKIDLAREIIYHVIKTLKIKVRCVNFDAFYGRDTQLLLELENDNIPFMADIPESHKIILEPFKMVIPKNKSSRGRKPTLHKPDKPQLSIKEYCHSLKASDYTKITVRHTSKGVLKAKFHKANVYVWDEKRQARIRFILLIRRDKDGKIYHSFTNLSPNVKLADLAYRQCKRYFIERAFQDSKQTLGMAQYECRSENTWSKHMALCMLAQLFINEEKLKGVFEVSAWLSPADIKNAMVAILFYTKANQNNTFNQIINKSLKTKSSIIKMIYLRI